MSYFLVPFQARYRPFPVRESAKSNKNCLPAAISPCFRKGGGDFLPSSVFPPSAGVGDGEGALPPFGCAAKGICGIMSFGNGWLAAIPFFRKSHQARDELKNIKRRKLILEYPLLVTKIILFLHRL